MKIRGFRRGGGAAIPGGGSEKVLDSRPFQCYNRYSFIEVYTECYFIYRFSVLCG